MIIIERLEDGVYTAQSKGDSPVYRVQVFDLWTPSFQSTVSAWCCQCEGFKHRGSCKHLAAVKGHLV
jgi:uncharacterized Zn finger protein